MLDMQNDEVYGAVFPVAIKDNAAWVTQVIDGKDAEYVEFEVLVGATDIAFAVLKVMESDTKTNDTTLGGTPAEVLDVTTKPGATDDNKVWIVGVRMTKARKRYIQLQATAGNGTAGTFMAAVARVRRSGNRSSDATSRGVGNVQYT